LDLELGGKTVIVTGGGSNIGRGIVLAFAAEGANVVNAEIDEEQGRKVAEQAMRYWPLRRLGRPEDIANTVLFLASDRAAFLTGQTIGVGGGLTM
jgi:NAD(P)-dependent dehydrogenase (short-subunit alcohol dehydrogenase family)